MPALLTTDYLAAEADTICAAVGRRLNLGTNDLRLPSGQHSYSISVHGALGIELMLLGDTFEEVLGKLAGYVGCPWPIPSELLAEARRPATQEQWQQLVRKLNSVHVKGSEKDAVLAGFRERTFREAEALLLEWNDTVAQRESRYLLHRRGLVGSAELVPAA